MVMNDTLATYTNSGVRMTFLWATTNTVTKDVWVDRTPTNTDRLIFWSPTMAGEKTLSPDDDLWDEIDAMLEVVWASSNIISVEEEAKIHAEMLDAIRESEITQFEELYGQTDSWE